APALEAVLEDEVRVGDELALVGAGGRVAGAVDRLNRRLKIRVVRDAAELAGRSDRKLDLDERALRQGPGTDGVGGVERISAVGPQAAGPLGTPRRDLGRHVLWRGIPAIHGIGR